MVGGLKRFIQLIPVGVSRGVRLQCIGGKGPPGCMGLVVGLLLGSIMNFFQGQLALLVQG